MEKKILSDIDRSIRKPYMKFEGAMINIHIFEHVKNYNNHRDSHLLVFEPVETGRIGSFPNGYSKKILNDPDRNLEQFEYIEDGNCFIIHGPAEILEIIGWLSHNMSPTITKYPIE